MTDLLKDDEHKKFINSRDSWGRTALHAACSNEGSGCLEILLNAGGNISLFDHCWFLIGNLFYTFLVLALVDTPCGPRGESRVCNSYYIVYNTF